MQKDSNRSVAVKSVRRQESRDSAHSDDEHEDQIDETVEKPVDPMATAKRVVFGGTYPIDRPLTLKFGAAGATSSRRQQMNLTLKTPRTFAIDEPIREDNSVEVRSVRSIADRLTFDLSASNLVVSFLFSHFQHSATS